VLANRPQQHASELAMAAAAHNQQLGAQEASMSTGLVVYTSRGADDRGLEPEPSTAAQLDEGLT
jgi:hypothetical protein